MDYSSGFGLNFMFDIFPFIFITIFLIVVVSIIINLVKGVGTWSKNNHSPELTVECAVVAKRISVSHHSHNNGDNTMNHTTSSTAYYATFQVESGDRLELKISGSEYGMLVEGDKGKLTFQGTRYKGFIRN